MQKVVFLQHLVNLCVAQLDRAAILLMVRLWGSNPTTKTIAKFYISSRKDFGFFSYYCNKGIWWVTNSPLGKPDKRSASQNNSFSLGLQQTFFG